MLYKWEFSVRKYLTPLHCTRLLFATGWWVCKSWQVEVKDRAERSEKTLTTMSKESLSDSHLFSHIPMPKLKSTLAKCATFIYSTHKFIKYKINWWTETCGNFGHLLLTLVLAFSETSYTNENTFKSTQMYVIVILNFPELYLNMQLTTVFLCALKANCVLIIDFWPYEICTMYMSLPDLWSTQYCALWKLREKCITHCAEKILRFEQNMSIKRR